MKRKIAAAMPRLGEFIPTMQPTYATCDEVMQAHNQRTRAEVKHDGYRLQIHRGKKRLWVFTRNGNELNYQCHPDIVGLAEQLPVCILDAEMVAEGNNHKEVFDNVKRRFRRAGIKQATVDRYLQSRIVEDIPLSLKVFDTLRFERKGLLHLPYEERDSYTEAIDVPGIEPVDFQEVRSSEELERLVDATFEQGHEGVICKDPLSAYVSGGRTVDWVKFKRSDTLDLAIVGLYLGNGGTGLPFTSVLCAAYNAEEGVYETIGKVGVTRDSFAADIDARIRQHASRTAPENVRFSEKLERAAYSQHVPDFYIDPDDSVVLEVKALNIERSDNWQTCGAGDGKAFSMRIGYVRQLRPDKSPRQATTTDAVWKLYSLQYGGGSR